VQCRIRLCGQNVNFVCGLVDKSLDVQINAIRIKFVKYKHKYRNQHAVLYTNCTRGHWRKLGPRFPETKSDICAVPFKM